jgi:hypothetical protein
VLKVIRKEDSPEVIRQFNSTKNFPRIKDSYFLDKLNSGLIKYEPSDWVVLSDMEENELR